MAQKIDIGGQSYLACLQWATQTGDDKTLLKALRSQALRVHRLTKGVRGRLLGVEILRDGIGASLGTFSSPAKSSGGMPSLLALAARTVSPTTPTIYVVDAEDGNFWVAGFLQGLPIAGSDQVLSEDEANDFVRHFTSVHTSEVYDRDGELENRIAQLPKKAIATAQPKAIRATPLKLLVGVFVLFVVVVGGDFALKKWKTHQILQKTLQESANKKVAQEQMEQQAKQAELTKIEQAVAVKIGGVPPLARLESWLKSVGDENLILTQQGWQLKGVTCGTTFCSVAYQRVPGGRIAKLLSSKPEVDAATNTLDEARQSIVVPGAKVPPINQVLLGLGFWDKESRMGVVNLLQALAEDRHVKGVVGDPTPIIFQLDGKPTPTGFNARSFSFESQPGYAGGGSLKYVVQQLTGLRIAPSLDLTQLELTFQDGRINSWKLNGNAVFKQS